MKKYSVYKCEFCGKTSKFPPVIAKCEAEHIGLSLYDYKKYVQLQENLKFATSLLVVANTSKSRESFGAALKALNTFKVAHNIEVEKADCFGKTLRG